MPPGYLKTVRRVEQLVLEIQIQDPPSSDGHFSEPDVASYPTGCQSTPQKIRLRFAYEALSNTMASLLLGWKWNRPNSGGPSSTICKRNPVTNSSTKISPRM